MLPAQKNFRDYKDLIVYQKSLRNSLALFKYYKSQKVDWVDQFVVRQFLRATASVGANIAEVYGRHYKKDYRRFLSIARGSSLEADHWIEILLSLRSSDSEVLKGAREINNEVSKMLTSYMKKLEL